MKQILFFLWMWLKNSVILADYPCNRLSKIYLKFFMCVNLFHWKQKFLRRWKCSVLRPFLIQKLVVFEGENVFNYLCLRFLTAIRCRISLLLSDRIVECRSIIIEKLIKSLKTTSRNTFPLFFFASRSQDAL